MQYSTILVAAASLALTQAKIAFTTLPSEVEAGKPTTLKWSGEEDGPVTILLRKGDSNDLKTIETITSSAKDGSFVWTPSKSLTSSNDYALQISQGVDDVNYTGEFSVSGGSGSDSSSASSASGYPTSAITSSAASSSASSSASGTVTKETTVTAANSTTTASHSVYITGTAPVVPSASGTGVNVSRNTTFSSATPTRASGSQTGGLHAGTTSSAAASSTDSSSETSAAATSASAGAASHMEIQIGAGLAAVLGLFAML